MESATIAVIFLAVWIGVLAIYCIFRLFGGRLIDILACDCCRGPLCDCWGSGGQIDKYDEEYPFVDGTLPMRHQTPQLPPIVIVNKTETEGGRGSYSSERVEYTNVERGSDDGYEDEYSDDGRPNSILLTSSHARNATAGGDNLASREATAPVVV
jgi:hypothetical protein